MDSSQAWKNGMFKGHRSEKLLIVIILAALCACTNSQMAFNTTEQIDGNFILVGFVYPFQEFSPYDPTAFQTVIEAARFEMATKYPQIRTSIKAADNANSIPVM